MVNYIVIIGGDILNIIEQNIDLNVCYPNNYQIIHAIQGDNNTIKVTATIWDKNELYTIVADSVALEWQSPSGHKRDCPITEYTKHTVSFILTNELLAENGDNIFVIRFENTNDDCKRTSSACVKVSGAPYGQLLTDEIETITGYVNKSKEYYDNLVTEKGKPNGIATLDDSGHLMRMQSDELFSVNGVSPPPPSIQRVGDYWINLYD